MQPQQFPSLKERLLRAGVAPRHTYRYIRELQDHYRDVLAEERAKGLSQDAAERAASARLGAEETLAKGMLSRPELRSWTARFPLLTLGAGPLFAWIGSFVLAFGAFFVAVDGSAAPDRPWLVPFAYALCMFFVRVVPIVLAVLAIAVSARQRMTPAWAMIGAAVLVLVSGTISVPIIYATPEHPGQIAMNSSLLPLFFPNTPELGRLDWSVLAADIVRSTVMFVLALLPNAAWRYRQKRVTER